MFCTDSKILSIGTDSVILFFTLIPSESYKKGNSKIVVQMNDVSFIKNYSEYHSGYLYIHHHC